MQVQIEGDIAAVDMFDSLHMHVVMQCCTTLNGWHKHKRGVGPTVISYTFPLKLLTHL